MAKLILSMDGLVLKEIPLTKERTTIGRKPHNDIQIDNLAVSGEHAVIVTILNDSFLEDLGSTNGTVVNGNPVKKHFLQNNDVIELGKYKLKFIGEVAPAAGAGADKADFEKTMVLRPSTMKAAAQAAAAAGGGGAAAAIAARQAAVQAAGQSAAATGIADKDAAKAPAAPAAAPAAPAAKPGGQPLGAIQLLSGGNAGKELELTRRAGRGADPPAAGLLHHACRGRQAPPGERPADQRRAARAEGSRCDRARRHQDGILPQDVGPQRQTSPV